MPIEFPTPPADADRAATDGVLDVHRAEAPGRARVRGLRDIGPKGRRLGSPHRVHNLRLSDVARQVVETDIADEVVATPTQPTMTARRGHPRR